MTYLPKVSRRELLSLLAAAPLLSSAEAPSTHVPIGLELYSVRGGLQQDVFGTLQQVAMCGYQCVEFYAPYYQWTPSTAQKVRSQLESLGLRCYSTHNSMASFTESGIPKAIELNQILGSQYVVMAHPGEVQGLEGWKRLANVLSEANRMFETEGLHAGYHNHDLEWKPVEGKMPLDVLANDTDRSVMLQLDVGTCLETGNDPVAWINRNPGRIRSLHLKDWSKEKGYRVLFGEGAAPWKEIFNAAEKTGGVKFYLIEQEGSEYPELETAERCLKNYKALRA